MIEIEVGKRLGSFSFSAELKVRPGEIMVVMGESGAGKSTLLDLVSGAKTPDQGFVRLNGRTLYSREEGVNIRTYQRNIGYVTQKSNLFPHLNVRDNILIGAGKDYDRGYYEHLVSILNIGDHLDKKVCQLSGGQQKRVSIARTFITDPEIILMDEPFSSLDNILRECLRGSIKKLIKEKDIMGILVTHDLDEGYEMADKALIVRDGHIVERRRGKDLFERPEEDYTKIFIRNLNFNSVADDLKAG
ncbi:ABC transporter [Dethiosulfatibacter aminovorans DSM 17477]|uniref:ABC transporter n=1 Tax=Dethiosulfatibacter aminovorans DSM 17477 TaxID=1121476 RepID=A0A1M6LJJ4_9FIRM|nr:ATP-binding cassette domain-containing protein [Dethiosulfatibacter aminovorans]SHJ71371.1 ABC transporter [Dethiosulfatibacter aminovorans DSM 17477]